MSTEMFLCRVLNIPACCKAPSTFFSEAQLRYSHLENRAVCAETSISAAGLGRINASITHQALWEKKGKVQ